MAYENPGVEELANTQNLNIKNIKNIGSIDQLAINPQRNEEVEMANFFRIPMKPKPVIKDVEPTIQKQQTDFAESIFNDGVDDMSSASVLADIADPELQITNSINFNHIQGEEGIAKTITAIDNKLPPTNRTTFEEIKLTGEHIDISEAILNPKKKSFLDHSKPLAPQIYAARTLLVDSANKLNGLAKTVMENKKNGIVDKELLLEFRRQMALHAAVQHKFKGAQTQIAQALASFRIDVDGTTRIDNIDVLLDNHGGSRAAEKMAESYLDLVNTKGQKAANKFAEHGWGRKTIEAIQELYAGGLLWSTKTLIRNFLGTAAYQAWELPTRIIAGSIGQMEKAFAIQKGINFVHNKGYNKLFNGKHWGGNHGYDFQQGLAFIQGYSMSFKDAFIAANEAFKKGMPSDARSRYEIAEQSRVSSEYLGVKGFTGSAIDMLGKTSGLPFKLMLWQDEFLKTLVRNAELRVKASEKYTEVLDAKGTKQEAEDAAIAMLGNPGDELTSEMDAVARHFVFQDDLGIIGSKIQAFQQIPGMKILMPFVKTPINIFKTISGMTGHMGTVGLNPKFWSDAKYRQRTMAQMTMTAGAATVMYQYYSTGKLTGAAPRDAKIRKNMQEMGWQPFSIVMADPKLPEGAPLFTADGIPTGKHTYYSYAGLEPIGGLLALMTTTYQRMDLTRDPTERDNLAMAFTLSAKDYFKEIPYLKFFGNITKIMDSSYSGDIGTKQLSEDILGAFIPFSAQLRSLSQLTDSTIYDMGADFELDYEEYLLDENGEIQFRNDGKPKINPNYGLPKTNAMMLNAYAGFNKIYDNLPGSKSISEMLERDYYVPRQDVFGNDVERNKGLTLYESVWNYALPFNIKKGEEMTTSMAEIMRLGNPINNVTQNYKGIKLTSKQLYFLTDAAKNETFINGVDFDTAIEMEMFSPAYWMLNDKDKYQRLQKIKNDYYDQAWDMQFYIEYFDVWNAAKRRSDHLSDGNITPFMIGN